jgi:hypothetical protein
MMLLHLFGLVNDLAVKDAVVTVFLIHHLDLVHFPTFAH